MLTGPVIFAAVFIINSGTVELNRSIKKRVSWASSLWSWKSWRRKYPKEKARAFRQTAQSLLLFMALSVALLSKMMNWKGGKIYLFVLISSDFLSRGWVESSRRHAVREETTCYVCRVSISAQSRATWFGTGFCICCYGYRSMFYCDALVLDNN